MQCNAVWVSLGNAAGKKQGYDTAKAYIHFSFPACGSVMKFRLDVPPNKICFLLLLCTAVLFILRMIVIHYKAASFSLNLLDIPVERGTSHNVTARDK